MKRLAAVILALALAASLTACGGSSSAPAETTAAAETYVLAHQLSDDPDVWKTLNFSEKQLS